MFRHSIDKADQPSVCGPVLYDGFRGCFVVLCVVQYKNGKGVVAAGSHVTKEGSERDDGVPPMFDQESGMELLVLHNHARGEMMTLE